MITACWPRRPDYVLLMTYEWGYSYGPPMAIAPIRNVRQVIEYALTEMKAEQVFLGIPNYGYGWLLPYPAGAARALHFQSGGSPTGDPPLRRHPL